MAEPPSEIPPVADAPTQNRSIPQTLKSFGSGLFWILWDWFWGRFNLSSVGDAMKEHSSNLNKKRSGVLLVLVVIVSIAGYFGAHFQKKQTEVIQRKLTQANETITQLRLFMVGKPTKISYAELMGLHDETNFFDITNIVSTEHYILVFQGDKNKPVLPLDAVDRIESKLRLSNHFLITLETWQDDLKSLALAVQIKTIFDESGFDVTGIRALTLNNSQFRGFG